MKKIINLYKKYNEIINYIIVGGFTTIVSLLTYYLCVLFLFDPKDPIMLQIANIISWIFSVTFAYFANRKYVFKSNEKNILKESIKFYSSRITTLLIDMLTMFILVSILDINDKISKILVQFIILILNYVFSKLLVFKKENNEKKENNYLNKIIKYIKSNKWIFIISLILFLGLSYCHFNTFLGNDDLPYSFFRRLDERVTNLFQVLWDNLRYYKSLNGRFIVHCIVMTLLIFGKTLWSILNPLVILGIVFILYKLLTEKIKDDKIKITTYIGLSTLFLSMYNFKALIYWVAGSINYLWVCFFILIYVYLYYHKNILKYKKTNFILLLLLSSLHENSLVFFIIFFIVINILDYIKVKKVTNIKLLIPIIIGGCLLLLAPGNLLRTSSYANWSELSILGKLNISIPVVSKGVFNLFTLNNLIPVIYIISIIFKITKIKINAKYKFIIILPIVFLTGISYFELFRYAYFILSIDLFITEAFIHIKENDNLLPLQFGFYAIAFSMVITPLYNSFRPNLLIHSYFIFIICKYILTEVKNKDIKDLYLIITSFALALGLIFELNIYSNIGKVHKTRLEQIEKFNKSGNSDILYLKRIPDKYTAYHVDCNDVNEEFWTYRFFIWYYNIKDGTKIRYK